MEVSQCCVASGAWQACSTVAMMAGRSDCCCAPSRRTQSHRPRMSDDSWLGGATVVREKEESKLNYICCVSSKIVSYMLNMHYGSFKQ